MEKREFRQKIIEKCEFRQMADEEMQISTKYWEKTQILSTDSKKRAFCNRTTEKT